jgi:nucleoid DNA-binding protein
MHFVSCINPSAFQVVCDRRGSNYNEFLRGGVLNEDLHSVASSQNRSRVSGIDTATLLNNLGTDGFTLKLGSFGKFSVRHKPGIRRKFSYSGEIIQTKMRRKIRFISLGALRQRELEAVTHSK